MFGTKKLAKRSIIGTAVCALCTENGIYYPGIITATSEWSGGSVVYSVFHNDSKLTKTYQVSRFYFLVPARSKFRLWFMFVTYRTHDVTAHIA